LDRGRFKERLDGIVVMTREMLAACREGAWDRFHDLEPRRRKEIMVLFTTPPLGKEAEYGASAIRKVIELDQEIIRICEAEKKSCAEQLAGLRHGRRVRHAYQDHQQDGRFF